MRKKQVEGFKKWLIENGAEIRAVTNPYEVLRYQHPDCGVAVVYVNKNGVMRISEATLAHFQSFQKGQSIRRVTRIGGDRRTSQLERVKQRDGHACCICGLRVDEENESIEHWLAISLGGNNHIGNLALAHADCNHAVSSMAVSQKMEIRDMVRRVIAKMGPGEKFNIKDFLKPVDVAS